MELLRIYSTSNLFSVHHRLRLWHIYKKMVVELVKNEKIAQFHVGYMSYPDLHQNKEFKDQVEKYELFI